MGWSTMTAPEQVRDLSERGALGRVRGLVQTITEGVARAVHLVERRHDAVRVLARGTSMWKPMPQRSLEVRLEDALPVGQVVVGAPRPAWDRVRVLMLVARPFAPRSSRRDVAMVPDPDRRVASSWDRTWAVPTVQPLLLVPLAIRPGTPLLTRYSRQPRIPPVMVPLSPTGGRSGRFHRVPGGGRSPGPGRTPAGPVVSSTGPGGRSEIRGFDRPRRDRCPDPGRAHGPRAMAITALRSVALVHGRSVGHRPTATTGSARRWDPGAVEHAGLDPLLEQVTARLAGQVGLVQAPSRFQT